jgi:phage gpG-like protein
MFGVDIRVEIDDKEFTRLMWAMANNADKLRPFFNKASMIMFRSFDLNFREQGRPRHWKRLSPNTIAGRRRGSARILQDTGRLKMSTMAKGAEGNLYRQGKDYLKMGSRLKIAPHHQYGTQPYDIVPKSAKALRFMTVEGIRFAMRVRHPGLDARPFVLIQDEDVKDLTNLAADHVMGVG